MRLHPTVLVVLFALLFALAPSHLAASQPRASTPTLVDPEVADRFVEEITVFGRCLDSRAVIYDRNYRPIPRPEDQLSGLLGRPAACYALTASRAAELATVPGPTPAYAGYLLRLPWSSAAGQSPWEWCTE